MDEHNGRYEKLQWRKGYERGHTNFGVSGRVPEKGLRHQKVMRIAKTGLDTGDVWINSRSYKDSKKEFVVETYPHIHS
jgi:hypothetical protein